MKNKGLLVLLIAGMVLVIIGALFKIMHWPGATFILIIGMAAEVTGLGKLVLRSLLAPSSKK